jgi:hypothetical protein
MNKQYRLGNIVQGPKGDIAQIHYLNTEHGRDKNIRAWYLDKPQYGTQEPQPIPLTKEWADKLGFEVIDMGDYWEFNKGDFQLLQIKVPLTGKCLPPAYVLHTKKSKHIKVEFVHKLQNLYYEVEGEELVWSK